MLRYKMRVVTSFSLAWRLRIKSQKALVSIYHCANLLPFPRHKTETSARYCGWPGRGPSAVSAQTWEYGLATVSCLKWTVLCSVGVPFVRSALPMVYLSLNFKIMRLSLNERLEFRGPYIKLIRSPF